MATTNPWHYAGSYTDTATGYLKLGARYYNPTTARFTQPDPAKTCGGYAYAGDDPVNNVDPTGRDYCSVLKGAGISLGVFSAATGIAGLFAAGTIFGLPAGAVLGAASGATAVGTVVIGFEVSVLC
jgi:RHS repeat-associated protein